MRILLAAPDRDLLECYRKILEEPFGEVVTAFDGTQIPPLLQAEHFDLVLFDDEIPRTDRRTLLRRIREKKIPVIEMKAGTGGRSDPLPDAYLPYPFTPEEICGTIREVLRKAENATKEENSNE